MPSCSHRNSESSIPEDLGSLAAESVPSEPTGHGQPESPDQSTINEEMAYSEDFKSSSSPGKLVSEMFCRMYSYTLSENWQVQPSQLSK